MGALAISKEAAALDIKDEFRKTLSCNAPTLRKGAASAPNCNGAALSSNESRECSPAFLFFRANRAVRS
jgi:hypothetical protein